MTLNSFFFLFFGSIMVLRTKSSQFPREQCSNPNQTEGHFSNYRPSIVTISSLKTVKPPSALFSAPLAGDGVRSSGVEERSRRR